MQFHPRLADEGAAAAAVPPKEAAAALGGGSLIPPGGGGRPRPPPLVLGRAFAVVAAPSLGMLIVMVCGVITVIREVFHKLEFGHFSQFWTKEYFVT